MSTTQLPRRIPHFIRPQCLHQPLAASPCRRPFSSSARVLAFSPKAKRIQLMQEDALSETSELNDFGILTGTIVRQPIRKLPSLLKEPKARLEYEWGWVKSLLQGWIGRIYYKFWISKLKPRPKLARRPVKAIAKQLHEEMYKSFANRDTKRLKQICCNGLVSTFQKAAPSKNEVLTWRLLTHLSRPRVVSNRASPLPLPGDSQAAVRQVVIRLHTRQILEKWSKTDAQKPALSSPPSTAKKTAWSPKATAEAAEKKFSVVEESNKDEEKTTVEKNVIEYVVMQRMMRAGKEQDWRIWGLAKETSLQDMRDDKKKMEEMNAWEATHPSGV